MSGDQSVTKLFLMSPLKVAAHFRGHRSTGRTMDNTLWNIVKQTQLDVNLKSNREVRMLRWVTAIYTQ